jgi:6-phosphogluconolactonase (cycloisomerase 2 family)
MAIMPMSRSRSARIVPSLLLLSLLPLAGCGGFFFKETPGSGGGTSATNYAFVANAGANTVTGLGISTTGALAGLTGSPITLQVVPTALTVSRDNKFLWVGTVSQIFAYSIATDGTLAALNNGTAVANALCTDMQTSPDGKWLMVLDGSGNAIDLFAIATDGTLSPGPNSGIGFTPKGTVVPRQLRIAKSGSFVVAAMGTAGEMVFSFNTTTGAFQLLTQTLPPDTTSDNGIAIDSTGTYLYEARSGSNPGLVVNTIGADGTLTPTTQTTYAAGTQPYSVVLDNTGKYVYVANRGDATVTGYTIGTSAALTAISGSPFSSGVGVQSLAADSSGKWILAVSFSGSPDLSLYGFDTTNLGRLFSVSSATTGTNASILALSH